MPYRVRGDLAVERHLKINKALLRGTALSAPRTFDLPDHDGTLVTRDELTGLPIWHHDMTRAPVPGLRCGRESPAVYWDAAGVQQTAGPGVVRYDHDPATGRALGPLNEPGATNLLCRNTVYGQNGSDATAAVANYLAPDGTTTAWHYTPTAVAGAHYLTGGASSILLTEGLQYTFSVKVKPLGLDYIALQLGAGSFDAWVETRFDLTTGAVLHCPYSFGGVGRAKRLANGWWLLSLTTPVAKRTIVNEPSLLPHNTAEFATIWTGDGVAGIATCDWQIEEGVVATSYIATTTAPATRHPDYLTLTTQTVPHWNTSAGTVVVEATPTALRSDSTEVGLLYFMGGGSNGTGDTVGAAVHRDPTTNLWNAHFVTLLGGEYVDAAYTKPLQRGGVAIQPGRPMRVGMAWNASDVAISVNRTLLRSTLAFAPAGLDTLIMDGAFGHIHSVTLYGHRLTDDELAAATTLAALPRMTQAPILEWTVPEPLPPGAQFTRTTGKTAFNRFVAVETVAPNTPAYDYAYNDFANNVDVCRGLTLDPKRTNLALHSGDCGYAYDGTAGWTYNGNGTPSTVTVNDRAAPDGTLTATRIVTNGANEGAYYRTTMLPEANTRYTVSIWVYSAIAQSVSLILGNTGGDAFTTVNTVAFLQAGRWTRISAVTWGVATVTATSVTFAVSAPVSGATFHLWGLQYEKGAGVSAYIPTTTAPVTRTADSLYYDLADLPNFNTRTATILIEFNLSGLVDDQYSTIFELNSGDRANDAIRLIHYAGASLRLVFSKGGNASDQFTYALGGNPLVPGKTYSVLLGWDAITNVAYLAFCGDTTAYYFADPASFPFDHLTRWRFGMNEEGGQPLVGAIRKLKVWPRLLTTDEARTETRNRRFAWAERLVVSNFATVNDATPARLYMRDINYDRSYFGVDITGHLRSTTPGVRSALGIRVISDMEFKQSLANTGSFTGISATARRTTVTDDAATSDITMMAFQGAYNQHTVPMSAVTTTATVTNQNSVISTGTVTTEYGLKTQISASGATSFGGGTGPSYGTIGTLYGTHTLLLADSGGSGATAWYGRIGTAYGQYIGTSTTTTGTNGQIGTLYGLYLDAQPAMQVGGTGGGVTTAKWAVYQAGANDQSYFAGKLAIGGGTGGAPASDLHIDNGTAQSTLTLGTYGDQAKAGTLSNNNAKLTLAAANVPNGRIALKAADLDVLQINDSAHTWTAGRTAIGTTVDGGGAMLQVGGSVSVGGHQVFDAQGNLRLRSYTVATLPSAASSPDMVHVSDASGGQTVAFSTGTQWLDMKNGAAVA